MVLLIVGRWEVVDRMNEGYWTHIGEPAYDAYLRGELNRALDILGSTGALVLFPVEQWPKPGVVAEFGPVGEQAIELKLNQSATLNFELLNLEQYNLTCWFAALRTQ